MPVLRQLVPGRNAVPVSHTLYVLGATSSVNYFLTGSQWTDHVNVSDYDDSHMKWISLFVQIINELHLNVNTASALMKILALKILRSRFVFDDFSLLFPFKNSFIQYMKESSVHYPDVYMSAYSAE